jgi:two-component system, cell cycle sensor histidine kinase and response regulator CckA
MADDRKELLTSPSEVAALRTERDYFRMVAERLGQKALADVQDFSRIIDTLRQTEEKLRGSQDRLEQAIAERTAELVQKNLELSASTARYDELVRRIPTGVYTLRIRSDTSMQFEYLSPQVGRILGLDPEVLLADAELAFRSAHPEDREALVHAAYEATRLCIPFRWECRFLIRGETRWIRLEADPVATPEGDVVWSGVFSDITGRKLTEEKLRESEELYRLLAELAPNAITVADPGGTIRMANPKALQLFGYDHDSEVIGANILEWVEPGCLDAASLALTELLAQGSVGDRELRLLNRDGTSFPSDISASLLRDSRGRPALLIIVASDATARRQAEAERLKLQKTEAIGTLAGGIAHDFNYLLQGVFGYIALAKLSVVDQDEAVAMLEHAELAITQAVNLTSQLLTFAKGGTPLKKRILPAAIIASASRFALSGSGTRCELALAQDLWPIDADEGQLGQVIQNVVLNASQAMQLAGTVVISADNLELPRGSSVTLPEGGRFVRVRVSDAGIGIAPQHLSKVFDPYFTTKIKGSGLGLATSYSIVKRHGGTVSVASEAGAGTTFSILLPAAAPGPSTEPVAATPPGSDPRSAPRGASQRKIRVLVMDDEQMVRQVATDLIAICGYAASEASDGEEAILKLGEARDAGEPFDLVILDLTVRGGMGGEEAIGKIRGLAPEIKAVVSSGYSDNSVVSDYRAYGFDAYLNKPYTLAALRECLAALLAAAGAER